MKQEKKKRSVVKTISWRVIATALTIGLVYVFTGNITIAAAIGGTDVVIKTIAYYAHERVWNKTHWGYNS
jgi:uncharacterized membrane protein